MAKKATSKSKKAASKPRSPAVTKKNSDSGGSGSAESDSVPRIALPDLFLILREFEREPIRTLEDLRLKICSNRKKSPSGDRCWSKASRLSESNRRPSHYE